MSEYPEKLEPLVSLRHVTAARSKHKVKYINVKPLIAVGVGVLWFVLGVWLYYL